MAPSDMLQSIFMPLVFMTKEQFGNVDDIGQIIGDMKDTFKMAVNGYPIFSACRFINKADWKIIREKVKRMEKAINKVKRENVKEPKEDYSI